VADRSDMSEVKLLESGKKARQLIFELDRSYLSIDEMENILSLIDVERTVLQSWLHALERIHDIGAREFYRASPTQAQVIGLDSASILQVVDENDFEPWLVERIRRTFRSAAREQFALKMAGLDALSQLGALSFTDESMQEKWISINPLAWSAWGGRGCNCLIHGRVKSGKTNLALLLAEHFLKVGFTVISNIKLVSDAPAGYIYCPSLSTMLIAVCNARLSGKEVLLIMDEANLFWQRIETIMPKNVSLSKLILCFGKMHCILCFISHYSELVPGIVAKTAVATFEKRDTTKAFVSIGEGPIKLKPRLLTGVPATTLHYDPDQLAYYSIDMSVDKLFDFMSTIPEGEDQWQAVLNYVGKHRGEIGEAQLDPKDIALWLRRHGRSEREIAASVQKSPSTVHGWVKEA